MPLAVYLWTKVTPAEPKPGSCLVLEEKYCKNFNAIQNPHDPNGLLAVAKIPAGVILFSPTEGMLSATPTYFFENAQTKQMSKYPGASIIVSTDGTSKTVKEIFSLIYYKEGSSINLSTIKKGGVIGAVSDKTIDFFGDYNLVVDITNQSLSEGKAVFTNANDRLKTILKLK